jgi:transcriptional regulator
LYIPQHFRENRIEVLQALIHRHPLATLVAVTPDGLTANHIPMLLELKDGSARLRGHIARGNSLWREVPSGAPVLAIFRGAEHYISPSSYPSKKEHGKAVPTWNYSAVHVKGAIRFIEDRTWLRTFVESLTDHQEGERPDRWHVSDAPPDYIESMLRAIVGFEIEVAAIDGKVKGSQNRTDADRLGAAAALRAAGVTPIDLTEIMPPPGS